MASEEIIAKTREQFKVTKPSCVAYGQVSRNYRDYVLGAMKNSFFVNWSSILTRLIQLAGQYCDMYASDFFILWKEFEKKFDASDWESVKHTVYGFRADGVDVNEEVYKQASENSYYYRKVVALDVETSDIGDVTLKFQEF